MLIKRIDRTLHSPDSVDGVSVPPRVSTGAALLDADDTAADVLRRADEAMYVNKAVEASVPVAISRRPAVVSRQR
jgi:GGDEF domain-containing protein